MAVLTDILKEDISKVCKETAPFLRGLAAGTFYGVITPFAVISGAKGLKRQWHRSSEDEDLDTFFSKRAQEAAAILSYSVALGLGIPIMGGVAFANLPEQNKLKYFGILAATNAIDAAVHYTRSVYKRYKESSKEHFEELHRRQEEDLERLRKCLP
jgi:uncharacterized protein YutE (UPF0331/DUF86 family)